MILASRFRSLQATAVGFTAVAAAFALGLGVGSSLAPASRGEPVAAPPSAAVIRVSAPAGVRTAHPAEVLQALTNADERGAGELTP